jgi:FtsH-binding integral membrane protein
MFATNRPSPTTPGTTPSRPHDVGPWSVSRLSGLLNESRARQPKGRMSKLTERHRKRLTDPLEREASQLSIYRSHGDDFLGTGRGESATIFGSTMELVALTAGFFALGAFLGHDLSYGWAWVFFILSFGLLIAMRFAVRSSRSSATGILFGFGLALGLGTGPTVAYYASSDPAIVWQAGGATALFMAGLGTAGYATRRDLSGLGRIALWALVGLIVFGVVSIFAQIPNSSLIYSILGLVIFAALTLFDFQRLRVAGASDSPAMLAASIFLDALNVFLFFLNLFNRRK